MALIPNNVKAVIFTGVMTITVTMVSSEEGERTSAYLDIVGIPTICYGDTENVSLGQKATHDECVTRLKNRLEKLIPRVAKIIGRPINNQTLSAITSFCDNVGINGCSSSDAMRRIRHGDIRAACDSLLNWTRAKEKRLALYNRRMRERALCLIGDDIEKGKSIDLNQYSEPPEWFRKRVTQWGLKLPR